MIIHQILLKEGALEVFTKRDMVTNKYLGIFWVDHKIAPHNPQGLGPFLSITQAMEHYVIAAKQHKQQLLKPRLVTADAPAAPVLMPVAETPINNVIQVDFQAKRRIS
jgi:hypothetical protein